MKKEEKAKGREVYNINFIPQDPYPLIIPEDKRPPAASVTVNIHMNPSNDLSEEELAHFIRNKIIRKN